jgi:hypothetical protein
MHVISFLDEITDNDCTKTITASNTRDKYRKSFTNLGLPTYQFMNFKITKQV